MEFPVNLFRADLGTLSCPSKQAMNNALALGFSLPYVHQDWPKTKYGPNGTNKVVNNADEESDLGSEWHDKPVAGEHFNVDEARPAKAIIVSPAPESVRLEEAPLAVEQEPIQQSPATDPAQVENQG